MSHNKKNKQCCACYLSWCALIEERKGRYSWIARRRYKNYSQLDWRGGGAS